MRYGLNWGTHTTCTQRSMTATRTRQQQRTQPLQRAPCQKLEHPPHALTFQPIHSSVGARRFELPTSCSRSRRATKLRYAPFSFLTSESYWMYCLTSHRTMQHQVCIVTQAHADHE